MFNYKFIVTGLLTIGSVVGVREYLKPRDIESLLKWKGLSLIASDNKNAWEASLYENSENLKKLGIENADALKNWCASKMSDGLSDESIVSGAEQYCQDNPKTIMGHIIRDGERERLIGGADNKAFQIVYVLSNDRQRMMKVISIEEKQKDNYLYIGDKVNKWCTAEVTNAVKDETHLSNVKRYCYNKGAKNVKQLLEKEGLVPLSNLEKYKERFKQQELNKVKELVDQIKTVFKAKREKGAENIPSIDEEEKLIKENDGQYLQWWCEYQYEQDLTSGSVFPEVYQRVKSRCAEKINSLSSS